MGDVVRLGIVVGLPQEAAILKRVLGKATPPVACAGAQPAYAAQAAAELIAGGCDALLSFGFAGGLDPALRPGAVVVGSGVVAPDGGARATDGPIVLSIRASLDALRCAWTAGLVAGVDQVVATALEKRTLRTRTTAIIADMESHAVAAAGRPFGILRVVVDPAERALPASVLGALDGQGRVAPGALLAGLLRRPSDIGALAALAVDAGQARRSLRRAAAAVGRAIAAA